MEEWKQRLRQAREQKQLNKTSFAKAVGVSNATVTDWEKSSDIGGIKELTGPNLTKVCAVLGITAEWLLHGKEEEKSQRRLHDDIPGAFRANHHRFRKIPAYGRAMGGMPDRIWDDDGGYPVGASDVYAEVASADPNAFLVPVEGTSMSPRFNPGEYALIEPNTEPELEDDVLVRLEDGRTMIKRLLSRRGAVRLGSYNSPEIISAPPEEIVWMYYVAHPVPARKIKTRI
ncbi:MAG: XRE family transcriptional regulator [Bacillota bacterium]